MVALILSFRLYFWYYRLPPLPGQSRACPQPSAAKWSKPTNMVQALTNVLIKRNLACIRSLCGLADVYCRSTIQSFVH